MEDLTPLDENVLIRGSSDHLLITINRDFRPGDTLASRSIIRAFGILTSKYVKEYLSERSFAAINLIAKDSFLLSSLGPFSSLSKLK